MRGEIRRLIEEARALPPMPPYVSYDALLADLARWVQELQGCSADIATALEVKRRRCLKGRSRCAAGDKQAVGVWRQQSTAWSLLWMHPLSPPTEPCPLPVPHAPLRCPQEVADKRQDVAAQLAETNAEEDREGHHRLKFLRYRG